MNLNDRALLVQLSISQWDARKKDKKVTADALSVNQASSKAGSFSKNLLPVGTALEDIHKKASSIRQKFYENTLPWGVDGTQILPTANYLGFMSDFRKEKSEWETLCRHFFGEYEYMKADAPKVLGYMHDDKDYPPLHVVKSKFNIDLAVFPVPSADFRTSIASDELQRIQQDVERRVSMAQNQAMTELWQRLYDRVKHMADKLADPKAIFRDSMVENAREICSILPRLNFADDPNLEALRQQVESSLAGNHPDSLRNDPDLRRNKAAEAKAIMDKMAVFMGGV